MFDIGWTELLVIAVVAIIIVGPKDLPGMLRSLGRYAGKLKRAAGEFRQQFDDAIRDSEFDDLRSTMRGAGNLNPANQIRDSINESFKPVKETTGGLKDDIEKAGGSSASGSSTPSGSSASSASSSSSASTAASAPENAGEAAQPDQAKQAPAKKASGGKSGSAKASAAKSSSGKTGGGKTGGGKSGGGGNSSGGGKGDSAKAGGARAKTGTAKSGA